MKKTIKFLFPVPSIVVLVILGILLKFGTINGRSIRIDEWISFMVFFFVFIILPLDAIVFIYRKIVRKIKERSFRKKESKSNTIGKESNTPIKEGGSEEYKKAINNLSNKNENQSLENVISKQESAYLEYQKALDEMGIIFVDLFKNHYFVDSSLLKSESMGNQYRFVLEVSEDNQLEYILNQKDVISKNMHDKIHINHMHGKYVEIITDGSDAASEHLKKDDKVYSASDRISMYNNKFDYMEGHDFEEYCAMLLKKNNFQNVKVTQGSGDQGIDILAQKDGIRYGIQCKCYSSDIGNKAVQEAFAGKTFYNCHIAAVLTNRYFTASAKELAEKNGVLLWDRNHLESLIHNACSKDAHAL